MPEQASGSAARIRRSARRSESMKRRRTRRTLTSARWNRWGARTHEHTRSPHHRRRRRTRDAGRIGLRRPLSERLRGAARRRVRGSGRVRGGRRRPGSGARRDGPARSIHARNELPRVDGRDGSRCRPEPSEERAETRASSREPQASDDPRPRRRRFAEPADRKSHRERNTRGRLRRAPSGSGERPAEQAADLPPSQGRARLLLH